ncbi:MAG: hypothetical protein KDC87_18560 [Planctomycetes bacterium]|nr:hypothetical protein [Planctomycetota bacterium]MCB9869850.1 hypothetical protein [Planctomycetota bacterium]
MHDGDDEGDFDEDVREGKVFRTGIDPQAERAWYALPPGCAALEGGPPEQPEEVHGTRWSRRTILGAGLLGVIGFAAGAVVVGLREGRSLGPSPIPGDRMREVPERIAVLLRGCRTMARGAIDDLVYSHQTFIWVVESHGGDDEDLWYGICRLADYALLDGAARGAAIAEQLLGVCHRRAPPPCFLRYRVPLQRLVDTKRAGK